MLYNVIVVDIWLVKKVSFFGLVAIISYFDFIFLFSLFEFEKYIFIVWWVCCCFHLLDNKIHLIFTCY